MTLLLQCAQLPTFSPMPSWMVWQSSFRPCSKRPAGKQPRVGRQIVDNNKVCRTNTQTCESDNGCARHSTESIHACNRPCPRGRTAGGCGVKVADILAQHGRQVLVPHVVHLPHACGASKRVWSASSECTHPPRPANTVTTRCTHTYKMRQVHRTEFPAL